MQPTMNNQRLQERELQTKGEVRLLEKKHTELVSSIERLQKSKAKEFDQYSHEISALKDEKGLLVKEVESLKKDLQTLKIQEEQTKASLKFFTNSQIAEINRDIKEKLDHLSLKEEALVEKDKSLAETIIALGLVEEDLIEKGAVLALKQQELQKREDFWQELQKTALKNVQDANFQFQQLQTQCQDLEVKIEELKNESSSLKADNNRVLDDTTTKVSELTGTVHTIQRREKEVSAREDFYLEKEKEIAEKSALLTQREEAVTRNIEMLRQKGVNI